MKTALLIIAILACSVALCQTTQPTSQPAATVTTQPANEQNIKTPDNVRLFGIGGTGGIEVTCQVVKLKNIDWKSVRDKITEDAKGELDAKIETLDSRQADLLKNINKLQYEKQNMPRPNKRNMASYREQQKQIDVKIAAARKNRTDVQKELAATKKLIPGKTYIKPLFGSAYGSVGELPEKYLKVIKVVDDNTVLCERIEAYWQRGDSKEPCKTPVLVKMNTENMKPQQMLNADIPFIKIGEFGYKDDYKNTSYAIIQPVKMSEPQTVTK